eukprot:5074453-Pyramimonas_sp.AAC.1
MFIGATGGFAGGEVGCWELRDGTLLRPIDPTVLQATQLLHQHQPLTSLGRIIRTTRLRCRTSSNSRGSYGRVTTTVVHLQAVVCATGEWRVQRTSARVCE